MKNRILYGFAGLFIGLIIQIPVAEIIKIEHPFFLLFLLFGSLIGLILGLTIYDIKLKLPKFAIIIRIFVTIITFVITILITLKVFSSDYLSFLIIPITGLIFPSIVSGLVLKKYEVNI